MSNIRQFTPQEKKMQHQESKKMDLIMRMYNCYSFNEIEMVLKELHIRKIKRELTPEQETVTVTVSEMDRVKRKYEKKLKTLRSHE